MKLTYMYPMRKRVSFTLIAKKHIAQLRKRGVEVVEADIHSFTPRQLSPLTLVHPVFYPLIDSPQSYRTIIRHADCLVGFDVCDTDKISPLAAYVANLFDLILVPTSWCKQVYQRSGVISRVDVLPHGVDEVFLREPREPKDPDVKKIHEMKGRKILFFLWHSGFRKGADVVAEAFARLVKEFNDVYLIVKIAQLWDPLLQYMFHLPNVVIFNKWLSDEDLVDLYDACDIVVCPSRGGGFELNALEGLARGKIVIVSQWGAFDDYAKECLRVASKSTIDLFLGDHIAKTIHCGKGVDPDPVDLYNKLKLVLGLYDSFKAKFERLSIIVKRAFTWDAIGERLFKMLKPLMS